MFVRKQSLSPKCAKCDGEGLIVGTTVIECYACDGTGDVFGSVCLICAGPGTASVETAIHCDHCDGVGYISTPAVPSNGATSLGTDRRSC
jgi:DnaJ-class molecular chaperone